MRPARPARQQGGVAQANEASCPAGFVCAGEFRVRPYISLFAEDGLRGFEGHIEDMVDRDERWLANTLDASPPGTTRDKKRAPSTCPEVQSWRRPNVKAR